MTAVKIFLLITNPTVCAMGKSKSRQAGLFGDAPKFKSRSNHPIKKTSLSFYSPSEETPEAIIRDCEERGRDRFFVLFSGGRDSQCVLNWMDRNDKVEAVAHIQTNVGLSVTTDFVKDFCQSRGYKLYLIEPSHKYVYAAHVLEYGFPGPGYHNMIMGKLKYKTMRDFAYTIDKKRACLVSGIRKFESNRRTKNYPEPIGHDGDLWFANPYFYKTNEEVYAEFLKLALPISPAYKMGFGTSGECLCGSFAAKGEKERIREVDPKLADYIKWLEEGVAKFGTPQARIYGKWGGGVKMSDIERQKTLTRFFANHPEMQNVNELESMICGNECGPGTGRRHSPTSPSS